MSPCGQKSMPGGGHEVGHVVQLANETAARVDTFAKYPMEEGILVWLFLDGLAYRQ